MLIQVHGRTTSTHKRPETISKNTHGDSHTLNASSTQYQLRDTSRCTEFELHNVLRSQQPDMKYKHSMQKTKTETEHEIAGEVKRHATPNGEDNELEVAYK
jgi:hypothetical protein